MYRWRAVGGVLGPAAVITAWAALGARTPGYQPVIDPISRLAASGADTQTAMTGGFLAYAAGVGGLASLLGERYGGKVALAAAVNVAGTLGIAATPLDSPLGGAPHALAAGVTYASLAALPVLAAQGSDDPDGRPRALLFTTVGIVSGLSLALSASGLTDRVGLFQRLGLTLGHIWVMAVAAREVRTSAIVVRR